MVRLVKRLCASRGWFGLPLAIELWDGTRIALSEGAPVTARLVSRGALSVLLRPDLDRLGEAYVDGRLEIDGPIRIAMRVAVELTVRSGGRKGHRIGSPRRARHTRASDAAAIGHHYDVSDRFYERFLDARMVYSCAYFRRDGMTLEQAQFDKLEHVCLKLGLRPGMRLLDVGCGWGALAIHAARRFGVSVVGITVSVEQYRAARDRVARTGLENHVEIRYQDYRDLPPEERFDRVASIGMFEHVGLDNLAGYMTLVERAVVPGGLALVHGITTSDIDGRRVGHGAGRFIERHVFPNGELPHVVRVTEEIARTGLELVDVESLRRHYAKTLEHWSGRFEGDLDRLREIGGERRVRVWRAYLAGCALGFERGWVNVYQLLAAKPISPDDADPDGSGGRGGARIDLPMTREPVYAGHVENRSWN